MLKSVIKRDGKHVQFNDQKIKNAVTKAMKANGYLGDDDSVEIISLIEKRLDKADEVLHVEEVQKIVEKSIKDAGFITVAKEYTKYRKQRDDVRQKSSNTYVQISNITKETDRENANVGNGPCGKALQAAEVVLKDKAYVDLLSEETIDAINENKIYPHDLAWMALGTTTCLYIPFKKLLLNGFDTGHGYSRTPQSIATAAALVAIIFQSNQNEQHGGQASAKLDEDLAPFVNREYIKQLKDLTKTLADEIGADFKVCERHEKLAWEKTVNATMQAMESLVSNLNTMHSRAGAQVPFTSINIGTDTTKEGRLISECLLKAYDKGLGKGEQPLFPNIIFKVKDGVNFEEDSPNRDLLDLAMKVTANRLYPIYNFQDCSLNKDFLTDVPSMGCRTRIAYDKFLSPEEQTVEERGNLSFTTINLPGLSLEAKAEKKKERTKGIEKYDKLVEAYNILVPESIINDDIKVFFASLDKYIDVSIRQLLDRFKFQGNFCKKDFPFLMSETWIGCRELGDHEKVKDVLKHGTLVVGFIGLAECLYSLYGKHHAESEDAQIIGLEIVKFMNEKINVEAPELYDMNFGLLATPAEGLTGKLLEGDKRIYGIVEGVTDKDWYTNSMHCPVEYEQSLFHKINIEGPYIKYLNAGNITYVELTGSPKGNTDAVWSIVKYLHDHDIALGAINFPCDRCRSCGENGTIEENCPICGSSDISRIRRITGYLAESTNFNHAKHQEMLHRVKHG